MSKPEANMVFKLPKNFTGSFTYVDCGAVGDSSNALLSSFDDFLYVGFDPELSLSVKKENSSIYFPVALTNKSGSMDFYRTSNLNCSSFFVPNHEFLDRFAQVGEFFTIVEIVPVKVVTLHEYLPQQGIVDVDFIELDTQGSELNILQGAEKFLSSSILGVRVEVEFSPMYHGQPLFADVDSFLRRFGFMLFDLDRYHLKRKSTRSDISSREQIVWGQALYFKDWKSSLETLTKQKLCKLALIASFYGFHSYAFEILEYLGSTDVEFLTSEEKEQIRHILYKRISFRDLKFLGYNTMKKSYGRVKSALAQMKNILTSSNDKYFWKD